MKLTVLGKYGPFPKAGEGATSGYLFEDNGVKIALDMGSGVLSRLTAATDISELDAIFVSHLHYDHTSDLLPLRYLLDTLGQKLTVITRYEDSDWYKILFDSPRFDVVNVKDTDEIDFKGVKLSFAAMQHPVPCLALKADDGKNRFVYTGDTVYFPGLIDFAGGVDMIAANCTKPIGFKGPHMTTADAAEIAEKTGAVVLATHFAPTDDPYEAFKGNDRILPAEEGKTYEIGR